MQEKLLELIEKIEAMAPQVWETVLQQQVIEGWVGAVSFLVFALISVPMMWVAVKVDSEGYAFLSMLTGFFAVVALGWMALNGVTHILNPEYHAMMDLMPGK